MFSQMVDTLTVDRDGQTIAVEQFEEFERHWVLYILQDKRYGQAFCEHFKLNIHTPLYHFKDENICRRWIRDNYGLEYEAEIH